jgi:hypothetical protein
MNRLVRIIVDDDGDNTKNAAWHLVDPANDLGDAALCTAEFFGEGESANVQFEEKTAVRGGITCTDCLRKIKAIKAVRL